jgi:hypothetical protein
MAGKDRKAKKAKWAAEPQVEKRAVIRHWPSVAQSGEQFSWRIGSIDRQFPTPWTSLGPAIIEQIHGFLANLEKMTWPEACTGGYPAQIVKLGDAPKPVRDYLESVRRDDTDDLVELRIGGKPRIWGVRRGSVCHLMWWDPEHRVWPSIKKHT